MGTNIIIPDNVSMVELAKAFKSLDLQLKFEPLKDRWKAIPIKHPDIVVEQPKDHVVCQNDCENCSD